MQQIHPHQHILVLGGSGFIGSHLIPELVSEGFRVTNYDIYDAETPLPAHVADVRGDIRDEERLLAALRGELSGDEAGEVAKVDAVLNLAAAHHDFGIAAQTFQSVNVGGAEVLTRCMSQVGIENMCFYSSVAIYGQYPQAPTEETPAVPVNEYGRTKFMAEVVYRDWAKEDPKRRVLILRPAVVFGPRNYANVYRMIKQISQGKFISVGSGKNYKSMVYVENIVAAIIWLWQQPPLHESDTYNCVDQPDLTSREIIDLAYQGLEKRKPLVRIPLRPALILAKPFDLIARITGKNLPITSNRIQKLASSETRFDASRLYSVGFKAPVSLPTGFRRMVRWFISEGKNAQYADHIPPKEMVKF